MKSETQEVKMGAGAEKRVVGTAQYPVYETIAEAVDGLGEETLLQKLNAQVRTDEMNRIRGLARNGPGKKALEGEAMGRITAKIDEVRTEKQAQLQPAGAEEGENE